MLKQPVGIIKLTNVALIKYKKDGKKFEIACYKNKAINWRNGVEKDLSEVLQIEEVYTNVKQGRLAEKEVLEEVFPKWTKNEIIVEMLDKGEMQVGEKEREALLDNLSKEILTIIQNKLVHPESKRPYSLDTMKMAMKSINFNVKLNQPAKKQANDCMKKLQQKYIIQKAEMLVQIKVSNENLESFIETLDELEISIKDKKEIEKSLYYITQQIDPSKYRLISESAVKNDGQLEILEQAIVNNSIGRLEEEQYAKLEIRTEPYIEALKDLDSDADETDEKPQKVEIKEKPTKKEKKNKKNLKKKGFLEMDGSEQKDEEKETEVIIEKKEESAQELLFQKKPKKKNFKKKGKNDDYEFDCIDNEDEMTEVEKIQISKNQKGKLQQISKVDKESQNTQSKKENKIKRIAEAEESEMNENKEVRILDELETAELLLQEEIMEVYRSKKWKCTKCKWGSNVEIEFKEHHKSAWHKHNLQQLQDGSEIITDIHFKEMELMISMTQNK